MLSMLLDERWRMCRRGVWLTIGGAGRNAGTARAGSFLQTGSREGGNGMGYTGRRIVLLLRSWPERAEPPVPFPPSSLWRPGLTVVMWVVVLVCGVAVRVVGTGGGPDWERAVVLMMSSRRASGGIASGALHLLGVFVFCYVLLLSTMAQSYAFQLRSQSGSRGPWPPRLLRPRLGAATDTTSSFMASTTTNDRYAGSGASGSRSSSSSSSSKLSVAARPPSSSQHDPSSSSLSAPSSQYDSMMDQLPMEERYNLLLQGRCDRVVEELGPKKQQVGFAWTRQEFSSIFGLLDEMTGKGIKCTPKTFAALVDAASLSKDMAVMHECLTLARKNGVCRAFSRDVPAINMPPRDKRTLKGLSPVPEDRRSVEVGAGVAALFSVGGSMGYEAVAPIFDADTTPATVVLALLTLYGIFDVSKGGGETFKVVMSGLNRLFLRDPEREARVQAATFMVAYLLGLPCFCFSPNVLEAVRIVDVVPDLSDMLGSTAGLNRLLVYLMAPVAAEEARHLQLIVSDPRQARGLLQIYRERNRGSGEDMVEDEEVALQWALSEARRLISANSGAYDKLRKRMESGGATVGDCVSVLEAAMGGGGGGAGGLLGGGWIS